jgi:isoquinoline 1-oxidoreductase
VREPEYLEPDRPELREPPAYRFAPPTRRDFLEVAGFVICLIPLATPAQAASADARIQVGADGAITVYSGKVEVGQGARTQIAMAVAEEFKVPLDRVRVVLGDTELCPNDGITAGSRTTPSTIPAVREAAAAKKGAAAVTPADKWQVFGTPQIQANARAIVTGTHQYPSDIRREGMLYGSVLRAPAYGAKLTSIDTKAAEKLPGVTVVRDGPFVAVAAPTSYRARKAVEALAASARWEFAPHPPSGQVAEILKATASDPRGQNLGSVEEAFQRSTKRLRATYYAPYIQHAPMEPRAAVAEWQDGKLTVWTGTQNPFGVRDQLCQAFGLPTEKVRVIVPDTGGGFGGKHTGETAIEAARLAKESGRPVSLRWTRTEEFTWAVFRPAGYYEIEAALNEQGRLDSWDFSVYNAGAAGLESPYAIPNTRTRFFRCDSPLREGSYRGIAATANNFARESVMEELATLAAVDPVAFRMANLENPRLKDVLTAVTQKFRWSERRRSAKKGIGVGVACGVEKGSYVAACVEVEAREGRPHIREFHMAYECGAIMNPSNLLAQVEGSIIQGLGGALTEEIRFEGGKLLNGAFSKYRVPRFRDVPPIEITLLDRRDLPPVGAGETPIIAVAPAIAAAWFDATGERARSLPISSAASKTRKV